jgi:hypothetical protein
MCIGIMLLQEMFDGFITELLEGQQAWGRHQHEGKYASCDTRASSLIP